ncbi:DUF3885 domain-containing protein [Plantactinospora endophytica]|uniref:DUF3885 domain-containing protein n=1 Tax=Plantactinospora endophytica TaxID=673535 RepID=A0ABQ4DTK7_9ACTN|nr:hypothetical protein [Plantactinospora endophytica]GIG85784.1 hypothetical protein Pen02_07200 [Plantactinospora endophytica]
MAESWQTLDEIREARARFEAALKWTRPVLHGIGFAPAESEGRDGEGANGDGPDGGGQAVLGETGSEISFVRVNDGEALLSAAVLATVADWHGDTGWVRLDRDQLAAAIELLTPAEACREVPHPNLRVWRDVQRWSWDEGTLVAVFDADLDKPTADPYVLALREVVASGRQGVPPGEVRSWPPPGADDHPLRVAWQARWPQTPPVGHRLRWLGDHWVRFHVLPDARRHPGTEDEYATVLHRHHTLLDELRGELPELLVITLELAGRPVPGNRTPIMADLLPDAECWTVLSWPDLHPQLLFAHAYVSPLPRQSDRLEPLLRAVADGRVTDVVVAPPDLSWLYAPYDGGADVLLGTPELRDELRAGHPDWLSHQLGGK